MTEKADKLKVRQKAHYDQIKLKKNKLFSLIN